MFFGPRFDLAPLQGGLSRRDWGVSGEANLRSSFH